MRSSFQIDVIPSTLFVWEKKVGVADMSTLKGAGFNLFRPIYSDAKDIGFRVRSERSGEEMVFVFFEPIKDAEGDFVKFIFESECKKFKIDVLND